MQRKPNTGLRASLCLSRAEASQRLPGPRGLRGRCSTALGGGRSRTPPPCAFRCCRRRTRGFGCKVCLGEREGAPVRGAEPRAARAGRLALALHCPEPPLGAQAGASALCRVGSHCAPPGRPGPTFPPPFLARTPCCPDSTGLFAGSGTEGRSCG